MLKFYEKHPGVVIWIIVLVFGALALLGAYTARGQVCEYTPRPDHLAPGSVAAVNHFSDKVIKLMARNAPRECIEDAASELLAERILQDMRLRYELPKRKQELEKLLNPKED